MTVSLIARATAPLVLVIAGLITLSTTLGGQIQTSTRLAYSNLKPGFCTAATAVGGSTDFRLQRLTAYHPRNTQ